MSCLNLTHKLIFKDRVFVNIGDLIPVRINNPMLIENMTVIEKNKNFLTCDDGSGIERTVVFRIEKEMMFFEAVD